MGKSLAEVDALSPEEWAEWRAYERLRPIGLERIDELTGYLSWMVHLSAGGRGDLSNFGPRWADWEPPLIEKTPDEIKRILRKQGF